MLVSQYAASNGGPFVIRQFSDGGFDLPQQLGAGSNCRASYIVDYNADSFPDVVSLCDNDVALFPGNNLGTFGAKFSNVITQTTEANQTGLAFGRRDADLFPDFVTVEWSGSITPLRGSASGSLIQGPRSSPSNCCGSTSTADQAVGVVLVDLNRDGLLDSVVATSKSQNRVVDVRFGLADGGFSSPSPYATSGGANMVTSADFNNDTWPDLAAPVNENNSGTVVSLLMNQRDGGFNLSGATVRNFPTTAAVGDFNGDAKLDLAVGLGCGSCGFDFVPGNGDGTFGAPIPKLSGQAAGTVVSGDLNGDGQSDLVVLGAGSVTVFRSRAGCPLF